MTNRERFIKVLNFDMNVDRLPMIEWAGWWDKTVERWQSEGLNWGGSMDELREHLGLDMLRQFWMNPWRSTFRDWRNIKNMEDYERAREHFFMNDGIDHIKNELLSLKELHDKGEVVIWITLNGFFWFPRDLFGIEDHFYAFYDYPDVMHKMNQDLADCNIRLIKEFCKILKPDFMTFAEDMSYNHGPMLSKDLFDEFLKPYYQQVIPVLKENGIVPIIDSDGDVETMIPWLIEAGIEGILPLERQAGCDIARIRENFPDFKMIGAFDKMVMKNGEEAMRQEFERVLPVMKTGGYIPSVDHQTPPQVSLENYRIYIRLLREYCEKAAK